MGCEGGGGGAYVSGLLLLLLIVMRHTLKLLYLAYPIPFWDRIASNSYSVQHTHINVQKGLVHVEQLLAVALTSHS